MTDKDMTDDISPELEGGTRDAHRIQVGYPEAGMATPSPVFPDGSIWPQKDPDSSQPGIGNGPGTG
jgi:hypothetical protein